MSSRHIVLVASMALAAPLPVLAQTTFVDTAQAAGVDHTSLGRGAAMVDFDGDGLLDLYCGSSGGPGVPADDVAFRQRPDHSFVPSSVAWGLPPDTRDTFTVLVTDFDNDGDPDIYNCNGGWTTGQANQLLRNDLDSAGTFVDVSALSGDGDLVETIFGGAVLDHDNDGDLDIFLAENASGAGPGLTFLLRNDGGLVFSEIGASVGMTSTGAFRHCGAGDIDNDGWVDVGAGNFNGPNVLYRNAAGSFADIAVAAGVDSPEDNYGIDFADFDNDGWLDIFLPKWNLATGLRPSTFLRNRGDGSFADVTAGMGTTFTTDMGHNVHDLDADGFPDVFIGTGWPGEEHLDLLYYIEPDGAGGLLATDGSAASGIHARGPTRCHGVAFGDHDEDGDVDVYLNLGGMSHSPHTVEPNILWSNDGNGAHWLGVDLRGVRSSRTPVGARLELVLAGGPSVHRELEVGSGFGNTDSPMQHFGLGAASLVERLIVRWPSGIEQTLLVPAVDTRGAITESGLRLFGQVDQGVTVDLELCGPEGGVAELLLGVAPIELPIPSLGGFLRIALPFVGPLPLPLSADGTLDLPVPLPVDPLLSGASLYIQAWIHDAGASTNSTLSNRIELAFP